MNPNLKVFIPLFIVLIVDAMGFGLVFPIIGPLLMDKTSNMLPVTASLADRSLYYGLTNIICFLALLLGAPFFGDLSDKFGRKKIMLICLTGIALGYIISAFALVINNLWLFILGRAIDGFAAGSESIAQAAIIDISPPQKKTINLGLISVAGCLGFIIGPLVGGIFSDPSISRWFGYTTPFVIAIILTLLNAVCLYFTFSETHVVNSTSKIYLLKGITMFKSAFTEKKLRILSLILIMIQVSWATYFQIVSLIFAEDYNYLPKQIGYFYAYLGIIITFTMVVLIRLFLRWMNERKLIIYSCIIAIFGTIFNLLFQNQITPWISIIFIGLGMGLAYACLLSLYSQSVTQEHQGWVMGIANSVIAVSWVLGGIMISRFSTSHFSWLLILISVFLTCAALITTMWRTSMR